MPINPLEINTLRHWFKNQRNRPVKPNRIPTDKLKTYENLIYEEATQYNGKKRDCSLFGLRENWLIMQRNIVLDFYYASYANESLSFMKYLSVKIKSVK